MKSVGEIRRGLSDAMDFDGAFPYFVGMLDHIAALEIEVEKLTATPDKPEPESPPDELPTSRR